MGGLGSTLRFLVVQTTNNLLNTNFPWGTLVVNIVGSILIGGIGGASAGMTGLKQEVHLACVVGLLGGFTTFSAFSWETISLSQKSGVTTALFYVALTNILGIGAAFLGYLAIAQNHGANLHGINFYSGK